MNKHKPTPKNINALFDNAPVVNVFTSIQRIPTQLKRIIKAKPDYQVVYYKEVPPKQPKIKELMRQAGIPTRLRGVGFTRPNKRTSKKRRKMTQASRKRNRK